MSEKAVAVVEVSLRDKALMELNKVNAGIAELKAKFSGKVYDCSNALGMAQAKAARAEVREIRYKVPKIVDATSKQLNGIKKEVQTDGARIEAELLEIENVSHTQIQAQEAVEEAKRQEKARLAAEAQKILDDKIIAIGKLPLNCIGKESHEISTYLAALEARPFGSEFSGNTLVRAEAAKTEAVAAIRDMLEGTLRAEARAAEIKAEQEAEAARLDAERIERERLEAIQREEMAAETERLNEQKRLNDIEAARLKEEANDKKREEERLAAIEAEKKAVQAEKERKVAEKALKLSAAKCANAATAFQKILDICNGTQSAMEMVTEIAIIAEAHVNG
jgi:chemosensory pili system protein ChpA (sensor histidine kinase/response regulator)